MSDAPFDSNSEKTDDHRRNEGSDPTDDGRPPETDHRWRDENLTEAGSVDIGRCRLERRLGCGGMAAVYSGQHLHTKASIAIKVIPRRHALATHLRREIELLAEANHPCLVKIIDHGENAGYCWLAMELLEGMTLAELIEGSRNRLSEKDITSTTGSDPMVRVVPSDSTRPKLPGVREIVEMFRRLALALASLHERGILHRDVKPSNIVVSPDGLPRICDFGLATQDDDQEHQRGILQGTIRYMAPEQVAAGHVKLDPSADLYSLAITFHEALTLVRPNVSESRESSLLKAVHDAPLPPSRCSRDLPRTLDPIFRKALARQPHDRYRSGADMARDIERWLSGRSLEFARETPIERAARLRVPIAVSSLLLIAAALIYVGRIDPDTRADRIRAAMSAEDWDRAFAIVDAEVPIEESDTGLVALQETLKWASAARTVGETLAQQCLAVKTPKTCAERRRRAAIHLRLARRWQEPNQLFRAIFLLMLVDHENAMAILDEPDVSDIGRRSEATVRLRRLVARASGSELREPWLSAEPPSSLDKDSDLCLRAFEMLWRRQGDERFGSKAEITAIEAEISRAINDLAGTAGIRRKDTNRLLLALRAQARSAMSVPLGSLEDLDTLLSQDLTDEQRAAAHYFRAIEESRIAVSGERLDETHMRRAVDSLRNLMRFESIPWLGRIAIEVGMNADHDREWKPRFDWFLGMLDVEKPKPNRLDLDLTIASAWLVDRSLKNDERDEAIKLAGRVQWDPSIRFDVAENCPVADRSLIETAKKDFEFLQRAHAWALYRKGEEEVDVAISRATFEKVVGVVEFENARKSDQSRELTMLTDLGRARMLLIDIAAGVRVSEHDFTKCIERLEALRAEVASNPDLVGCVVEVLEEVQRAHGGIRK